jgi:formylglycine-generating enzyme required for sulfatase activity
MLAALDQDLLKRAGESSWPAYQFPQPTPPAHNPARQAKTPRPGNTVRGPQPASDAIESAWEEVEPAPPDGSNLTSRLAWIALVMAALLTAYGALNWQRVRSWLHPPEPPPSPPGGSTQPNAQVQNPTTNPSPPVAAAASVAEGWLELNVLRNTMFDPTKELGGRIERLDQPWHKDFKLEGFRTVFPLEAGNYSVTVTNTKLTDWKLLKEPVEIAEDKTNRQDFAFKTEWLELESDPPGASVTWPVSAGWADGATTGYTPCAIERCKSGAIPLVFRLRHYFDRFCTNYFYPSDDPRKNVYSVKLTSKPVPLPFRRWTNSLNMVFLWVPDSTNLWACEVETRVRDYRAFVEDTRYESETGMYSITGKGRESLGYSWRNPGPYFAQTNDSPVIGVSWTDAASFCQWLTQHERRTNHLDTDQCYRLPTTKEWFSLAAGSLFPWGDTPAPMGNYSGTEVQGPGWPAVWPILEGHDDKYPRTAPVYAPEFETNKLGFRHLGGNAAEWCQEQVLCGGSWFDGESGDVDHLQTRVITFAPPNERNDRNGFRVFLEDIPPK